MNAAAESIVVAGNCYDVDDDVDQHEQWQMY